MGVCGQGGITVQDSTIDIEDTFTTGTNVSMGGGITGVITQGSLSIVNSGVSVKISVTDKALTQAQATGQTIIGMQGPRGLSVENSTVTIDLSTETLSLAAYGITTEDSFTFTNSTVSVTAKRTSGNVQCFEFVAAVPSADDITLNGCALREGVMYPGVGLTVITAGDVAGGSEEGGTSLITPLATDAGVAGVTVAGSEAKNTDDGYAVTLPAGLELPCAADIVVTPSDSKATVSTPVSSDGGATWTFTVTAEDGATVREYTLHVTVAPDDETAPPAQPNDDTAPPSRPDDGAQPPQNGGERGGKGDGGVPSWNGAGTGVQHFPAAP